MSMVLMRTDLAADPRVVRVAAATKTTKVHVIGALHWLWSMGQTQSNDGFIPLVTFEAIDAEVGIAGFAEAMRSAEWLEEAEGGVLIPDFEVYNGKSAKSRAKDRLRKTRERWNAPKGKGKSGQNSDKTRTKVGQNSDRVGTELGQNVDKKWTTTNNGSDRIGSDQNGSNAPADTGDGFEEFWAAWPKSERKVDRAKCAAHWAKAALHAKRAEIMAGLAFWKRSKKWTENGGAYIEAPLVWLHNGRWAEGAADGKPSTPAVARVSDAEAMEFRRWWRGVTDPSTREKWATTFGVAANTVDTEVGQLRVRFEWAELAKQGASPAANGGGA